MSFALPKRWEPPVNGIVLDEDSEHYEGLAACWPLFEARDTWDYGPRRFGKGSVVGSAWTWPATEFDAGAAANNGSASNRINTGVNLTTDLGIAYYTPFSWCLWAYVTASGTAFHATDSNAASPYNGVAFHHTTTDRTRFYLSNNSASNLLVCDVLLTAKPVVGRWVRWVVTYDGSSSASGLKIFADGSRITPSVFADSLSASIYSADPIQFSGRGSTLFPMNGGLCDFRIYNRELPEGLAAEMSSWDDWSKLYWRRRVYSLGGTAPASSAAVSSGLRLASSLAASKAAAGAAGSTLTLDAAGAAAKAARALPAAGLALDATVGAARSATGAAATDLRLDAAATATKAAFAQATAATRLATAMQAAKGGFHAAVATVASALRLAGQATARKAASGAAQAGLAPDAGTLARKLAAGAAGAALALHGAATAAKAVAGAAATGIRLAGLPAALKRAFNVASTALRLALAGGGAAPAPAIIRLEVSATYRLHHAAGGSLKLRHATTGAILT